MNKESVPVKLRKTPLNPVKTQFNPVKASKSQ